MKWCNVLSTRPSLEAAVQEVAEQAKQSIPDADFGIVFISSAFASEYPRLMPLLQEALPLTTLIGCSGGGIVGSSPNSPTQELEQEVALSLMLANLPGVKVTPFHLRGDDLPDLDASPNAWVDLIGVDPQANPQFILLADPFSAAINDLLQGLDYAYPGCAKVGGLASGTSMAEGSALFCGYRLHRQGSVGVALSGNVVMDTVVAQGCRPIGSTYRVREGERNIILKLQAEAEGGEEKTSLDTLQDLYQELSDSDRALAQHSLFIGIAQNEFKTELEPGDFLIRNLIGVDPRAGAIAIGDRVRPGQRVQFHLRDAQTSLEDLSTLLSRYKLQHPDSPAGALMFSCLGRGEGLYGKPNVDSGLFHEQIDTVPIGGFFCNGEIGPVGDTTFLHGYTSVFGILRSLENA